MPHDTHYSDRDNTFARYLLSILFFLVAIRISVDVLEVDRANLDTWRWVVFALILEAVAQFGRITDRD